MNSPRMSSHRNDIVCPTGKEGAQFESHLLCDRTGVVYAGIESPWTSWRLKKDYENSCWRVDAASMEKIHGVDVSSFASYKSPKGEWSLSAESK